MAGSEVFVRQQRRLSFALVFASGIDGIPQVDPVLKQRATMELLMVLIRSRHSTIAVDIPNLMTSKQDRMKNMNFEEQNAIRYTAGCALRKLKKVYEEQSVVVCQF